MASSLALKRLISANFLSRSFRPAGAAAQPAYSRLFNNDAVRDHDGDADRCTDRRVFGGVFDPFCTRSSLSQIRNMMDQFMASPATSSIRQDWGARETENGLQLLVGMPGIGMEGVKVVSMGQNNLFIRGEGRKECENHGSGRRYSSSIDISEKLDKTNGVKVEMKDGVPEVSAPGNLNVLRPLSPHLPIYKPQLSSTFSICNRISGAYLTALVLFYYLVYLKLGFICFTYESVYQFMFYFEKLIPISLEIAALALTYHTAHGVHHLWTKYAGLGRRSLK